MSQVVTRFYKDTREILSPVSNSPTISWAPQLVFNPGYYSHNGLVYDLTQPGLYRFWNPMVNTTHMCVGAGDYVGLLTGAAWLSSFGDEDQKLSSETQSQFISRVSAKARTSKVKLLCENTVDFTRASFLASETTRKVRFLTMETPNNVVDGHVALEIFASGGWVLADVSLNSLFTDSGRLCALDAVTAIANDSCIIEPLALDGYAVELASSYSFDATGYAETFLLTAQDRLEWQHRIFQAVGIDHTDGLTYFTLPAGSEARASWVTSLSSAYRVVSLSTFITMFYP